MKSKVKLNYFIIPVVVFITAAAGGFVTAQNMDWYQQISLPSWTPAGKVIGNVWTTLFALLVLSVLLAWNKTRNHKAVATTFGLNLILNFSWSFAFFGLHQIGLAIILAALLGISVFVMMIVFWRYSKTAGLLLLPYLTWVAFATYLNYQVWLLN